MKTSLTLLFLIISINCWAGKEEYNKFITLIHNQDVDIFANYVLEKRQVEIEAQYMYSVIELFVEEHLDFVKKIIKEDLQTKQLLLCVEISSIEYENFLTNNIHNTLLENDEKEDFILELNKDLWMLTKECIYRSNQQRIIEDNEFNSVVFKRWG